MRTPTKYGKRSTADLEKLQPKIRYFMAFEGEKTEHAYFTGIKNHQNELGINELINIVPLLRHYDQRGWSNPEKVCDLVINQICHEPDEINLENFLYKLRDWMINNGYISSKTKITDTIIRILSEKGYSKDTIVRKENKDFIKSICDAIDELNLINEKFKKIIAEFKKYLKTQQFNIHDGDVICLIVDRDKDSFTEWQYDKVIEKCENEGIRLYVNNPKFEFWLLLHFLGKNEIDETKLLQRSNPGEQLYLEKKLSEKLGGFSKRNIHFELLLKNIDTAISNEKEYCEKIDGLKTKIGSNIGLLLTEMRNRK